jgi:hypothetical protein
MALSAKKLTAALLVTATVAAAGAVWESIRIQQIQKFNAAIVNGKTPTTDTTLIFLQLLEKGTPDQKSAVQYNLGNIFFLRGLLINGRDMTVRDEAVYLFTQAKTAYMQSLRLANSHWDARHNLDRILMMLPDDPSPGVGDSDSPGLIMGNIPVGLP